ncbi:MAG: hypothetical protein WDM92_01720 [Caulobacteraceae bacterium]
MDSLTTPTKFLRIAAAALAAAVLAPAPLGETAAMAQDGDGGLHISLKYDGRLLLKVLEVRIEERATVHGFGASARLTSSGVLAAFKHIDEQAATQGRIAAGEPAPGAFEYVNLGGKTHRRVRAVWTGGDVAMSATPGVQTTSATRRPPAPRSCRPPTRSPA